MNTQATIKTESKTCICSIPMMEVWLVIPDEYEAKYPYPLRDAKFCPVCGERISEVKHGVTTN